METSVLISHFRSKQGVAVSPFARTRAAHDRQAHGFRGFYLAYDLRSNMNVSSVDDWRPTIPRNLGEQRHQYREWNVSGILVGMLLLNCESWDRKHGTAAHPPRSPRHRLDGIVEKPSERFHVRDTRSSPRCMPALSTPAVHELRALEELRGRQQIVLSHLH